MRSSSVGMRCVGLMMQRNGFENPEGTSRNLLGNCSCVALPSSIHGLVRDPIAALRGARSLPASSATAPALPYLRPSMDSCLTRHSHFHVQRPLLQDQIPQHDTAKLGAKRQAGRCTSAHQHGTTRACRTIAVVATAQCQSTGSHKALQLWFIDHVTIDRDVARAHAYQTVFGIQ